MDQIKTKPTPAKITKGGQKQADQVLNVSKWMGQTDQNRQKLA